MVNNRLYNLIIIVVVFFTIVSCGKSDEKCDATYFGGQIVNPRSDVITLMKDDKVVEEIQLNPDNTFLTELNVNEGLYYFSHGSQNKGYEIQFIYIEPKDSILIRLNTWDFDESLVFSGRGSEKNNFLISLYLLNEKEDNDFSQYYNLNSGDFENRIESLKDINSQLYEQLEQSGVKLSKGFKELAKVAIYYPLYSKKERYPWIHKNRFQLDQYPTLSESYYDFRKENNLNNSDLIAYMPYMEYINIYISAMAHQEYEKGINTDYTENKLNAILANITDEEMKNYLLQRTIYNNFRSSKTSCDFNKTALAIFNENCTDKKLITRMNKLAEDCESIKSEKPIINFEIANLDSSKINIKSVIDKRKSVIYFWSPAMINADMLVKRVNKLKQQYPSLLFVGINMYPSENGSITNDMLSNQYNITRESDAKSFLRSNEPRTILVDENGIILNAFTYITSPHLESQLSTLEKHKDPVR